MLLSAEKIRELLSDPVKSPAERLVVSPVLDAEKQLKAGTASIDVRLGQRFHVPLRTKISQLDRLSKTHRRDFQRFKEETFVPIGDYFVLHPRQFVLGETLEWIHLPGKIAAYVVGRSTWGRDGLIIATAIGVHPHFSGILTLELSNIGEIPVYLYPGLTIAQLFLMSVEIGSHTSLPIPSTFQSQTGPHGRDVEIEDVDIIKAFEKQYSE